MNLQVNEPKRRPCQPLCQDPWTQIRLGLCEDAAAEVGVAQHSAAGGGEEKLIGVTASHQLGQGVGQECREGDDAALVRLWGSEDDLTTDLRSGLIDGQPAPLEVDPPDAQCRRLSPTDSPV
jgi:hypothetical protein